VPWSSVPEGTDLYAHCEANARLRAAADVLARDSLRARAQAVALRARVSDLCVESLARLDGRLQAP
jgi:hypothetical protein